MTYGHCNIVYDARLGQRELIVRTYEDSTLLIGTASNLNQLAALGLPVPEIIAMDLSKHEHPFAFMISWTENCRD